MKKIIFTLILISIVLIGISCVSASQDTNISDVEVDAGSNFVVKNISTGNFKDLQNKIDESIDGSIVLDSDYKSDGSNYVEINKVLTIDGQGHTLRGNGEDSSRFITVKDCDVNLMNIVFNNSKEGFVKCTGNSHLTIYNCTFIGGYADDGGAILNKGEYALRIINSTFIDNHADSTIGLGGAVYSNKEILIINSIFIKNSARKNTFFSNPFTLRDKSIDSTNYDCGGAVCSDTMVSSFDSSFVNNTAYGNGGAISSNYVIMGNTIFENNTATGPLGVAAYGGAVRSKECIFNGSCVFINNYAKDYGGALYTKYLKSDIVNCTFRKNHADDYGGCLYVDNKYCFNIESSCFENNYANAGDGGAIYSDSGSTTITLTNSTFKGNYATGGVAKRDGGAIYSKGPLNINNSTFNSNWAENRGGAIYCDDMITFKSNKVSYFTDNTAEKSYGGAIYVSKLNNNVCNLVFTGNKAKGGDGGALYINNKCTVTFSNCYFNSNTASGRGGAIYTDSTSSKLSLKNNIFYYNHADDQGHSVFNSGEYTSINNNWWGLNNNNGNDGQLYEYHRMWANDKHEDSKPGILSVSIPKSVLVDIESSIIVSYPWTLTNGVFLEDIVLSSNKNGTFVNKFINGSNVVIKYIPYDLGLHSISISICGQKFTGSMDVGGNSIVGFDFVKNYGDSTPFTVTFKDASGNLLSDGTVVNFIINNVVFNSTVNNGIAKLNINLKEGNYTVKSVNTVTGDTLSNQISIIPRVSQYYTGDVYSVHLHNSDGSALSEGSIVDFVIGNKTFKSTVLKDGLASFNLDLKPGRYYLNVYYSGSVIYCDSIMVSNRLNTPAADFTSYGFLKPIVNETVIYMKNNIIQTDLGDNYYRIIDLNNNNNYIMYNATANDTASLLKLFKKIANNEVKADIYNIDLYNKEYFFYYDDTGWEDSDYRYLLYVPYGKVIINGNGASIIDADRFARTWSDTFFSLDYDNNRHIFSFICKNAELVLNNITIWNFAEVYKNMGTVIANNTVFKENVAEGHFDDHKTYRSAVLDNYNQALFIDCVFANNRPLGATWGSYAGVLYADQNSYTTFVNCDFKSEKDTIISDENANGVGTNINFYTSKCIDLYNREDGKIVGLPNGFYGTACCVSVKHLSAWYNSSNIGIFNCSNTDELYSALKQVNGYNNYTSIVINLNKNVTYEISSESIEKISSNNYHNKGSVELLCALFEVGCTPLTINGNGATIIANNFNVNDDYHFTVISRYGSAVINNVTFKKFTGVIHNFGTGKVNNVTFDSNIYGHYITNYNFGAAIYNEGFMYCYNCTFTNNAARLGGAIYSTGSLLQIEGGTFKNNKITGYGSIKNIWDTIWGNDDSDIHVAGKGIVKLIGVDPVVVKKDDALVLKRASNDLLCAEFNITSASELMNIRETINYKECAFDVITINLNFKVFDAIFNDLESTFFDVTYGNLIINGNGATIRVNNPDSSEEIKFLKVGKLASVVVNNLNICGFNIAILNDGALDINNCSFKNNKVNYKIKDDYAGAIHNNGYCNIYHSNFVDNYGKYAGAVYNKGYCNIFNSTFSNNVDYKSNSNIDVYNFDAVCNIIKGNNSQVNVVNNFRMSSFARDSLNAGCQLAVVLASFGTGYLVNALLINHAISAGFYIAKTVLVTYGNIAQFAGLLVGTGVGTVFTLSIASREHDFNGVGTEILKHALTSWGYAKLGASLAQQAYQVKIFDHNARIAKEHGINVKTSAEINQEYQDTYVAGDSDFEDDGSKLNQAVIVDDKSNIDLDIDDENDIIKTDNKVNKIIDNDNDFNNIKKIKTDSAKIEAQKTADKINKLRLENKVIEEQIKGEMPKRVDSKWIKTWKNNINQYNANIDKINELTGELDQYILKQKFTMKEINLDSKEKSDNILKDSDDNLGLDDDHESKYMKNIKKKLNVEGIDKKQVNPKDGRSNSIIDESNDDIKIDSSNNIKTGEKINGIPVKEYKFQEFKFKTINGKTYQVPVETDLLNNELIEYPSSTQIMNERTFNNAIKIENGDLTGWKTMGVFSHGDFENGELFLVDSNSNELFIHKTDMGNYQYSYLNHATDETVYGTINRQDVLTCINDGRIKFPPEFLNPRSPSRMGLRAFLSPKEIKLPPNVVNVVKNSQTKIINIKPNMDVITEEVGEDVVSIGK